MDETETAASGEAGGWTWRPLLLAGLGLATGVVTYLIAGEGAFYKVEWTALQAALLMAVTLGAAMIGFTIERQRWWASIVFAAVVGVAGGFVTWWNGAPGGWNVTDVWRTFSLLLAVAIAAPLFQAARDEGAPRAGYPAVHDYAWANVVLWCACWLFVLLVWLMAWLLGGLFELIKIHLLRELLGKDWFVHALTGLAFGSALGLLREHDAIVRLLQKVVTTLLAVLAPVLAIGLGLFLLALPFTGVQALWDATSATTPLLLTCAAGALILANDVIGAREADERRNPLLRYSAMVLAAVILPLAILAAVATGLRIGQYGYTPERLWAVVFVGVALCWGLAYFGALAIRRLGWTRLVRRANLVLACAVCVLGLVLATPLINFNAISTRDQVARLESGKTNVEKFDWRALAFDFGKPGREALARLKNSGNAVIRARAIDVGKAESPYTFELRENDRRRFAGAYDLHPAGMALPEGLKEKILSEHACEDDNLCRVYVHDAKTVTVIDDDCIKLPPEKRTDPKAKCLTDVRTYLLTGEGWRDLSDLSEPVDPEAKPVPEKTPGAEERAMLEREYGAISGGGVVVRKVEMRQVFIGDKPQGRPFK
ncbi:DUF4153 domain-containing protein [Sphingomonas kyeonggiensis]|uniref:DUF4153 domain-containing protein n=1 Tax=Sphingomonas kyeonggiensis TaxID=1268553 RepID=A0A7W6JPE1_9SPHN|nr:DUF4153 domain-containing protein [Sphingomonas kyeonggiensis]MBB4097107.1 hypothetical protein [Sphingomonas kyeonggiensis]